MLGREGKSTERLGRTDCESLLGLVRPDRAFGGLLPPDRDFVGLVLPDRVCSSGLRGSLGLSDSKSLFEAFSRADKGEYRAGMVGVRERPFLLSRLGATLWCSGGGSKWLSFKLKGSILELVDPDRNRSASEEASESVLRRSTNEASERALAWPDGVFSGELAALLGGVLNGETLWSVSSVGLGSGAASP